MKIVGSENNMPWNYRRKMAVYHTINTQITNRKQGSVFKNFRDSLDTGNEFVLLHSCHPLQTKNCSMSTSPGEDHSEKQDNKL